MVVFVAFTFVVFVIMFNTLISLIADIFDRYMEQRVVEGLSAKARLIADFERGVNFHEFSQSISNCFSYIAESLRRRNVAFVKDAS